MHKNVKNRKIFGFLSFLVSFRDLFHLENSKYFTIEDYCSTISCLVERFQNSYSRSLLKVALNVEQLESVCNFSFFRVIPWFLESTEKYQNSPQIHIAPNYIFVS